MTEKSHNDGVVDLYDLKVYLKDFEHLSRSMFALGPPRPSSLAQLHPQFELVPDPERTVGVMQ